MLRSLDRSGLRWILAAGYSLAGRMSANGPLSVRYDDGWVHRFEDTSLVELRPRRRVPEVSKQWLKEYCGYLYEPAPGNTIIDVGAGYGWETLNFARRVGRAGRVVAIEAHPTLAAMLKRNVDLNGLKQVTPLNYAIADSAQSLFIEDDLVGHIGNAVSRTEDSDKIEVQARSLDQLCSELGIGTVDFLKMNIEGAEQIAIRGMTDMIARTRFVAISCHDFKADRTGNEFFRTKKIVEDWLSERAFVIVPRSSSLPWLRDQVNAYNPALAVE
jgi:FkbM family methyltransferase